MRRILLIATLCLLAVALCGCKKARLRAQLKGLLGSTIALPEKISCVYNGGVYPMPDSLRDMAKLIVYIDSTRCSTCEISHLPDLFLYGTMPRMRCTIDLDTGCPGSGPQHQWRMPELSQADTC